MTTRTGYYPIRTVSEITGITPVTLRAWERRYGLVKPARSPKGHRLYNEEDVALIREVVALLESGIAIGQARHYLEQQELQSGEEPPSDWARLEARLLRAIEQFNETALERSYNEALALYPADIVTERLVKPTLRRLGERWQNGLGSIAEEHFFSTYLRNKLGARLHHTSQRRRGPKLLAACFPGEQHELGLLLYCVAASERAGYRFIILGADTPLEVLPGAQRQSGATGILLSGSATTGHTPDWSALKALRQETPTPVLVGGYICAQHHERLVEAGTTPLGIDTATALQRMEQAMPAWESA
ncbi:MAG: MerR family transcriptional regulator [Pseudomonadota bacterium]